MRRKFLLKVMILSLLFVAMGGSYLYSQDDVTIVTTETDLATALAAGGNVKLGNDIAVTNTIEIPRDTNVTLDLNGKSITANGKIYPINNDGRLTINDSGSGGTIEGLGLSTGKTNSNNRSASSKLTINGGIFRNVYPDEGAALYVHMGIVEISGGKFYGQNVAISNTGGYINASNCFIDGYNYAVNATASTVISDAEISGKCIINDFIETTDVTFYQARIGEATDYTSYKTLEDAIKAAKSGDEIYVFAGTWDKVPAMKAGITINGEVDGDRKVVLNGTLSGTLEDLTLKNLHIKGDNAQRWGYAKGYLYFENVTFEATSVYAIHFDGITEGANLLYKNCTIIGWAAMSGSPVSCIFENCTIRDNGTYGVIRTYFNATIKNCTFDIRNANPDDVYQDGIHAVSGADLVVDGCTNIIGDNGETGDMKDIVNVSGNSTVEVDGVLIQNPVKVGDNYYATIQDAIVAAAPNGTVELLADVTVDKWIMFSERLSIGNGNIINTKIDGLTIKGNGKKVTIKSIESAGNGNRLFYDATNLNIQDLTIECVDAAANQGGIGLTSGTISNVNFIGGGPAILPGTGEITVTGCTFKTNGTSIYYEEARDNLVVNGNTFENPDGVNVILLRGNTEFTNNIIESGRTVNVVSGSPVVSGNDFKDVRFKVYNAAEATISNNTINNLEFNDESVVYSTFTANTLSDDAQAALDAMIVAKIGEVKYCSLQKAVDAAQDGDVITLVRDCAENVTVTQKADVKFTIDGAQKTMTGAITVDGQSGQIETAGLTIQNVKFDASNITTEASINLGVSGNTGSRYVSNLTVEGCTFIGKDQAKVAVKSYTGGDKNLTVTNCIVDATMHSLLQVNNVEGKLTLTGCTVKSKNGVNLNSCTNVEMTGCNFDVQGYALRSGVSSGGNPNEDKTFVINNNILKSACNDGDAVIMFRTSSVNADFSMTKNVVSGTTHISGTTKDTNVSADANYWDGEEAPVVAEGSAPIVVNSYYADEALKNLVRNEIGSIYAFVSSDRIFGEVTTNAIESIKIEIIGKDGHVIGSSTLEKTEHATGFNNTLTWRINLGDDDSGSWAMTWNEGCPSINNMPAKVKLYVDAKEGDAAVAEAEIRYTANGDGASPVFAAKTNAEGKINSFIACTGEYNLNNAANKLVSASADGDNIAILVAGTYNVPTGKNLTITGAVDGVQFDMGESGIGMNGASVTFNNVTFNWAAHGWPYHGLQHCGDMKYNNCTINGTVFLYGTSEIFNNCIFNVTGNTYNVWTYGAKEVVFNECTFNSDGKSVLVYNEGACATDLTVTDTKFIATATVDDKAAIEIDCSLMPKGTSIVIDGVEEGKTTATGFGENTKSGSSLWNDKKVVEGAPNGGTSSKVIIDDVVVKEPALMDLAGGGTEENPYLISNLEDLIWFRYQVNAGENYYQGKYIALAADIDLDGENWVGIGTATADHGFMGNFDGKTYKIKNLTITNPALDSDNYAYAGLFGVTEGTDKNNQNTIKNLTIENVTITTTGHIAAAAVAYPYYTIIDKVKVCGDIKIQGGDYTAGVLAYTRRCVNASNLSIVGNEGSFVKGNQTVGGVISDIQMNGGLTAVYNNFSAEGLTISGTKQVGGISGIISQQTLDVASVKNVTLNCSDARVGIVSGSLGGVSTVSNVVYENVTGATAIIGATYDGGKAVEAKIGDTYYATLQTAIDAAQDGTTTINILADITGDVTILQQEGKNIVIDGKKNDTEKYTFNGTINIYGDARISGEETLTIQNINFYTEDNARYFIHAYDNGQIEGTNNHKQYAHNVTVENCKFATSAGNKPNTIVGMRFRQANDMSAVNCTSDGIFSIMWTTAVDGLTLNGVEATNCTEGITIGGASKKVNIIGTTIESDTYAIRAEGAGSDFIIENSTLVAKVPVVVRNVTENSMISFTFNGTNTITESNPTNYWFVAGVDEYSGENEQLPETAGQVSVTLNDTGLDRKGIYGSAFNGEGTEDNPYLIETVSDLVFFRDRVNGGNNYAGKHVKLAAGIDLSSIENWTPIGNITYNSQYKPVDASKVFSGVFDGNGKVISNLKIERTVGGADTQANVGLFGITGEGAAIKDLTLTNVNIETDGRNVGALAGFAYKATLSNITVNGNIQIKGGNNVAGVAGMTRYHAMSATNINVIGDDVSAIVGNNIVGGIFAEIAPNGSEQTFNNLSVENVAITGASGVGGIVGLLTTGAVYNVTVKNVVLTGRTDYQGNAMGRIRLGSIAGLMGGQYATIANVITKDVTAKNLDGDAVELPVIGANYDAASNATEAKIGDTYYATFSAAFAAVQAGETVTLLADVNISETLKVNNNITLDLNGKTITGTDNATVSFALIEIQPGKELVVNDATGNGKITLRATNNREWNAYSSVISNQRGKLTVNGGTIEHLGGTDMAYAIDNLTNGTGTYAETVINGGTIKSTYRAIRQFLNGTEAQNILTVNGGIIEGANKSIWMQDPSKNANTGTLTVDEDATLKGDVYLFVTEGSTEWPVEVSIAVAALAEGSEVISANVPAGYEIKEMNSVYGVYHGVAKIDNVLYESLAEAATAAQNGETIELLWQEGQAPIAMNASLYGKNVTITGKANVDWSKGWFFVGRGGAGNATLTFDGANLTSASNSSSYGIHVSGREKDTDNRYDGTLVIKNSTIELDYLIDRGTITLDEGAKLTVKNGFGIAGRPASETEIGENATATISLVNGAELIVKNHNGMGVGQAANVLEGYGIMHIDATSTFETTQNFNISANGTMNNAGTVNIAGALTNNGTINFTDDAATLATTTGGLTINYDLNPDKKVVYVDGVYKVVEKVYVAQIGDDKFESLQEAVNAATNDATIVLIKSIEQADGVLIEDKNITIDLNDFEFNVTEGASTNNRNFRIIGTSVVTIKNGTMYAKGDYSSGAYGTVRTEGTSVVTLDDLKLYNYRGNGLNIKAYGGTTVNISNTEIYSQYGGGIEAAGGTINIAETVKVEQKGMYTAPYNSMAISVNGGGVVEVNGGTYSTECITAEEANGQGTSHGPWVVGVLNSGGGGTLIINGGTFSNDNYGDNSLATYARGAVLADTKANVQINGGTFNALAKIFDIQNNLGDAANNPTGVITGGVYSADPTNGYVLIHEDYKVEKLANGYYTVIQIAGTQTREFATMSWHWFSTYINYENGEEGLDELQEQLDGNAATIKGQTAFTNYQTYNGNNFWTSGNNSLTSISASNMYMIRTINDNVSVSLEGRFVDYEQYEISIHKNWNWIGYPLNTEVNVTDALAGFTPENGDQIKGKIQGQTSTYISILGGWTPDFAMMPGEGYMYYSKADDNKSLVYRTGDRGNHNVKTSVENNHWIVDEYKYSSNMTVTAMLSIDGEIVKDNYEVAAFANGECRGSARPIYIEALDAYMLFMTIQGEDVENLTFKYYDVNYGTEYELNNTMVYSNDAIVGTIEEPYMFNLGILNIDETSVDQISIYPNPTTTGKEINLQAMCDKVEVFNALGVKVAEYTNVDSIDALETAGIYVIRVTIDGNARNCRLIVK